MAVEARNFEVWEEKIDALWAVVRVWACTRVDRVDQRVWTWERKDFLMIWTCQKRDVQVTLSGRALGNIGSQDGGFLKWGTPKSSKSWVTIFVLTHIETHGDLGIPHFRNSPYELIWLKQQNLGDSCDGIGISWSSPLSKSEAIGRCAWKNGDIYDYICDMKQTTIRIEHAKKDVQSTPPRLHFSPCSHQYRNRISGCPCNSSLSRRTTCCAKEPTAGPFPAKRGTLFDGPENQPRNAREPGPYMNWLVVYLSLWKIWKSVGMIIPNIWENKIHVPNHQPVNPSFKLYAFPLKVSLRPLRGIVKRWNTQRSRFL